MPDQIMYYFSSSSGLTSAQLGNALVDGKNYIDYMGNLMVVNLRFSS